MFKKKMAENKIKNHNLNIYMYSFEEILELFDLNYHISIEDLKRAKKKVLMIHPDKSKLPADYFLFYKKAFDMVLQYYENNNKQNQAVTKENTQYDVSNVNNQFNTTTDKKITSMIQEMKPKAFQEKFNELFEKNMAKKPNKEKNDWFYKEDPVYQFQENVTKSNMNSIIENMKTQNQGMIPYQGVMELGGGGGTRLYEEDEEDTNGEYVSCDPFSKLKFDDLRKVHKDQTVFAVGEKDFHKMKTYGSVEQMNRERGSQDLTPLKKEQAERLLAEQQRMMKEKIANHEHRSNLKTKKYEEKNKSILSTFLQLTS
jgi:hypothetical protein